jgi:hypothetical protein
MEAEMKMVFQQKVQEKESKLKQSEEELYARHKEMKDALDKQRSDLEEKKRKIESGRPLTPEKSNVSQCPDLMYLSIYHRHFADYKEEPFPQDVRCGWTPENYAGLALSFGRPYLTFIAATCLALLRLRLVFLYRTICPNGCLPPCTLLCHRMALLPLSSFSMILSLFCFYVESLWAVESTIGVYFDDNIPILKSKFEGQLLPHSQSFANRFSHTSKNRTSCPLYSQLN